MGRVTVTFNTYEDPTIPNDDYHNFLVCSPESPQNMRVSIPTCDIVSIDPYTEPEKEGLMIELTIQVDEEVPNPYVGCRTFKSNGELIHLKMEQIIYEKTLLPTIPGTAIWANTKDDPQASLDAFFLNSNGFWMDIRCRNYRPEQIHTWKPYSEHTPQPYD